MIDKEQMKLIIDEYQPDDDIFSDEDDRTNKLKHIIYDYLDEVDRRCLLMYAELGSLRKLGNELGISASSAYIKIKAIKETIYDKLNT